MRGIFLLSLIFLACEGKCETTTASDESSGGYTTPIGDDYTTSTGDDYTTSTGDGYMTSTGDDYTASTGDSYTASTGDDYTASTGDDYTSPTQEPCLNYTCPDNQGCNNNDGRPYCTCEDGYVLDGEDCVKGCDSEIQFVICSSVNPDVENCTNQNQTQNDINAHNISVFFSSTAEGRTAVANITCNKTCDNSGTQRAIGFVECQAEGKWSTPTWTDCGKTEADMSTDEKLTNALIDTNDPASIDEDTVSSTVDVLAEVANQTNIPTDTADNFMETTNNLLLATNEDAKKALKSDSASLLDSINELANNVDLSNSDGKYQSEESNIALAVIGDSKSTKSLSAPKATADSAIYYYGFDGNWDESYNLAASGLQINTEEPNGSYIESKRTGDAVLSFQMYSQVNRIFSDLVDGLVAVNVIYAVNGSSSFTMNFRINRNITTDTKNQFDVTKQGDETVYNQLQCVRWNVDASNWNVNDTSCGTYSAGNFYAKCTCSTPGQYTMRTLKKTTVNDDDGDDGDDGLSGGAIAGIVIGCLAGVALIAGAVFYFMKRQKKGSLNSGYDNASMSSL